MIPGKFYRKGSGNLEDALAGGGWRVLEKIILERKAYLCEMNQENTVLVF